MIIQNVHTISCNIRIYYKEIVRYMCKGVCVYNLKTHPEGNDINKLWKSHNVNYYEVIKKHKVK